jgi:ATP-dependent DNA helicase PIF1
MPFTLRRRQFPVRPAFAMTINKAQGQTLKMVGIFLPKPVFTHG